MNDRELVAAKLPGIGHAIAAAPHMCWPAEGVAIWPPGGQVGIRRWHATEDVRQASFSCSLCGHAQQPWAEWVSLARRIIAADEAMQVSNGHHDTPTKQEN